MKYKTGCFKCVCMCVCVCVSMCIYIFVDFPVSANGKELPAIAGDVRDEGLIPGSERPPAGGYGNPLQYSCLENPMERRTWWAMVHRVSKSWT